MKGRRERRRRRVGEREIEPYQAWATEREMGGGRRKATGLHFTPAERLQPTSRTAAAAKPSRNQPKQLVSAQPNTVNLFFSKIFEVDRENIIVVLGF